MLVRAAEYWVNEKSSRVFIIGLPGEKEAKVSFGVHKQVENV